MEILMRDKRHAGILAILFGWLGLHYLYLGRNRYMFFVCCTLSAILIEVEGWTYLAFIAVVEAVDGIRLLLMNWHVFNKKYNRDE